MQTHVGPVIAASASVSPYELGSLLLEGLVFWCPCCDVSSYSWVREASVVCQVQAYSFPLYNE